MAENQFVGSPLSKAIVDQLEKRGEVLRRASKSEADLEMLTEGVAWVKLRSSVNKVTPQEQVDAYNDASKLDALSGDDSIAKEFILSGGRLGVNSGVRAGIQSPDISRDKAAYQLYKSLGHRPMPGITGLSVKSKNSYGTILEAVVKFVVWTVEDLEECELLYFRPGYSALLEWGHSVYVNNEGSLSYMDNYFSVRNEDFFTRQRRSDTDPYHPIDKIVEDKRQHTVGNYEGMFGFITNFSWSFRKDGGYDCSVKLLSRGAILEGLKVGGTTANVPADQVDEESKEQENDETKSIFHYIFSRLEEEKLKPEFLLAEQLINAEATYIGNLLDNTHKAWRSTIDITNSKNTAQNERNTDLIYITLQTVLDILNNFCTLRNPVSKGPPSPRRANGKSTEYLPEFCLEYGEKFLTFDNHFTVDPLVSFPPKQPSQDPYTYYTVKKNNIHASVERYAREHTHPNMNGREVRGGTDDVLNIPVSFFVLRQELNKVLDGAQEDTVGILDFIKGVLSNIEESFGGINSFGLFYDTQRNLYKIIDRNAHKSRKDELPLLTSTGLRSTLYELSIDSKISNQIASMVAIAAQGSEGSYKDNVATLLRWNAGAIDRHFPVKWQSETKTEGDDKKKEKKFKKKLKKAWDSFNRKNQAYKENLWNDVRQDNTILVQSLLSKEHVYKKEPNPGVIPVELSMKMKGISGLVIGTAFRIEPGLLPKKYENYGYIITGVEHEIGDDGKWITSIRTQFYSLEALAGGDYQKPVEIESKSVPETAPVSETPPPPSKGTPNADRLRSTLSKLGHTEKGSELSNGGDISPKAADMGVAICTAVSERVPGIKLRFTGGNDTFHQKLKINSTHKAGKGLDFTVTPSPTMSLDAAVKQVLVVVQEVQSKNAPRFKIIDEYSNPSAWASGDHIHVNVS